MEKGQRLLRDKKIYCLLSVYINFKAQKKYSVNSGCV